MYSELFDLPSNAHQQMKLSYYDVKLGLNAIHLQMKILFQNNAEKWVLEHRISIVYDHWTASRKIKMLAIMINIHLNTKNTQICIFFDIGNSGTI